VTPSAAAGSKFRILYNFTGGSDGGRPVLFAALAIGKAGNLVGPTAAGGYVGGDCPYGCGTVFEMTRGAGGRWSESVLFEITDPMTQGYIDSPLALDGQGDVYGCNYSGPMFELTSGTGQWTTTQWTFNPIWPWCDYPVGLILDDVGNLYGEFGNDETGGVSELSPSPDGWVYTNLYEFCQQQGCPDGVTPLAPFSWDAKGNLYGTTYSGGDPHCNCGVAFQMTPNGNGTWTYHVMHRFTYHKDGADPAGSLTLDASGNAYGTTTYAGPHGNGNVFKLIPTKDGRWKLTVIYGFPNPNNGLAPGGDLVFDKAGNLYGMAGSPNCNYTCGLIFKLSPQKNGKWNYSVLHRFNMSDGDYPNGLTADSQGNLYGTTRGGGKYGYGVVFELTP
jgi:uncharacterized repeat protein (TIGR03803 family)